MSAPPLEQPPSPLANASPEGNCASNNDPDFNKGNFALVSADGTRFVVPGYVVFAASKVFADAHALSSPSNPDDAKNDPSVQTEIDLSDPVIETAAVVRLFLKFATTLELPINAPDTNDNLLLVPLLKFLDKWECPALSRLLVNGLFGAAQYHTMSPLKAFYIGAMVNDADLCTLAFESKGAISTRSSDCWWAGNLPDCSNDYYYDSPRYAEQYPWVVSGWSYRFWRDTADMPHQYRGALVHACESRRLGPSQNAAEVFRTKLKEAFEADKAA